MNHRLPPWYCLVGSDWHQGCSRLAEPRPVLRDECTICPNVIGWLVGTVDPAVNKSQWKTIRPPRLFEPRTRRPWRRRVAVAAADLARLRVLLPLRRTYGCSSESLSHHRRRSCSPAPRSRSPRSRTVDGAMERCLADPKTAKTQVREKDVSGHPDPGLSS